MGSKLERTDEDWKKLLTPQQYEVLRRQGTERAFTGALWDEPQNKKKSTNLGPGRPKSTPDSKPRKTPTFKPRLRATVALWARESQEKIVELLNPALLNRFGKKNMRSMTNAEFYESERIKFEVLCNHKPLIPITLSSISVSLSSSFSEADFLECQSWIAEAKVQLDRQLTIEEERSIRLKYYLDWCTRKYDEIDDGDILEDMEEFYEDLRSGPV